MIFSCPGRIALGCVLLAGLLSGCASKPPPPAAPGVGLRVEHFSGSPLSGPTTRPVASVRADTAILIDVRIVALAANRVESLAPVGPNVRLISVSRGGSPLMAAGEFTSGCRFGAGPSAQKVEAELDTGSLGHAPQISQSTLALPPAVTGSIRLEDPTASKDAARSIQLYLHRPAAGGADQLEIALAIEDFKRADPQAESTSATSRPAPITGLFRELMLLQSVPIADSPSAALLIPFDFSDGIHHSAIAIVHISRDVSNPQWPAGVEQAQADLKASADAASKLPSVSTLSISDWPGFETALAGIRDPATARVSLSYLAGQTGARVCEDASLVATDQVLADASILINKEFSKPDLPHTAEALGWALDVAMLNLLSQRQSASALPSELLAVLLRHTGQVGANSGSVGEMLALVGNRKDFESRLSAENFVYLEDNSPAARVRAFDWLTARGEAPPGYDPLAPPKQRQDALQKAYDALAAKSVQQAQQGGRP